MLNSHSDEIMETTCLHCHSRFRITGQQVQTVKGMVRCGECGKIFNSRTMLENYSSEPPSERTFEPEENTFTPPEQKPELSLHEAMYGYKNRRRLHFSPLLWLIGITLLSTLGVAQAIYYQRYPLIENPQYQKQILNLCQLVPCDQSLFSSTQEIKLLDRNVYTHPVQPNALMITGSFVNQAVFDQKLPKLLVSLFDLQGNLIANRLFTPTEYLQTNKNRRLMATAKPVQFRLEVSDPGTDALTYEFEFM